MVPCVVIVFEVDLEILEKVQKNLILHNIGSMVVKTSALHMFWLRVMDSKGLVKFSPKGEILFVTWLVYVGNYLNYGEGSFLWFCMKKSPEAI